MTSSSSSPHTTPFASRPQKYPRAQRKAAEVAQALHGLIQKGPRTLVATVVDTSFHAAMGYVTATTQLGLVQVYGIPAGGVVTQMRVFVRQIGPHATNRAYIFDGFAPALSNRGLASGSLLYFNTNTDGLATLASTSGGSFPTNAALTSATGYYWHFFLYLPMLPPTRVTLWSMALTTGNTNYLAFECMPTGQLVLRSTGDNHGYFTTKPVPPHSIHWIVVQPGLGSGDEFLVDGQSSYTGIASANDVPTFVAGGATPPAYDSYFLSNPTGGSTPPVGTWISKMGYGTSAIGGVPVQLAVGESVPTGDGVLPNQNDNQEQQTTNLYTFTDTANVGGGTITNVGAATPPTNPGSGATTNIGLNTGYVSYAATGPY